MLRACLRYTVLLLSTFLVCGCGGDGGEKNAAAAATDEESQDQGRRGSWPLRFVSEVIELTVEGDSVTVDGRYHMDCKPGLAKAVPIFYPFPQDSLMGGVRPIRFRMRFENSPWRPVRHEVMGADRGVRMIIPIERAGPLEVMAVYRQALLGDYARYIVTSTQSWRQALLSARFEVHLPESAAPVRFSHPFERVEADDGAFYLFEAENFMPEKDIVIEWGPALVGDGRQ